MTLACSRFASFGEEAQLQRTERRLVVSGQGFFPVAQRLQDGRIAVVMRGGADHVGIKGRLDIVFSEDSGRSWSKPAVVVDSPVDDRNPAFGQAQDGALVVAFWRAAKDTFTDFAGDEAQQGVNTWVTRSFDGGASWSSPAEIDVRDIGYGSPYGKILTLPDGTMLMNVYGHGPRDPGDKLEAKEDHSYLYLSRDHGQTWKRHATIGRNFNETGLLRLANGTLLAAMRSADDKASVSLTRSTDGGLTWTAPNLLSQPMAHPADLTLLHDGRVLLVTGFRTDALGVRGVVSDANGMFDWSKRFVLVSDSTNVDTGYPSSVVLDDGRVLTFYYAVGSKTHQDWGIHCGVIEYQLPSEIGAGDDSADQKLAETLDRIAPEIQKWATICAIEQGSDGTPVFRFHDYRETGWRTDFWPASTIKLYAAIAALEFVEENGFPMDTMIQFEHQEPPGKWIPDCARSLREMLSEVFSRSSNEDYTLLLRLVGIDRVNTQFLVPGRGFPHSALMRGYVTRRPYVYNRTEPQRVTLRTADGTKQLAFEHTWSGRFYAAERGCTVIDANTGNVTSPRELAECLRRVMFHEHLSPEERYRISSEQLDFLRYGGGGLVGLETRTNDSGPAAWSGSIETIFPKARFFHKVGVISNYALELAMVDDMAHSGLRFILVPAINAGEASTPKNGEKLIGEMSRAIAEWIRETKMREKSDPPGNQ